MCEQNGEFVLHGVVSRGSNDGTVDDFPCAFKNFPDIAANVFNNMDFVKSVINVS